MLILLDLSQKKSSSLIPKENFFESLLKIFREVILDLSGLDFSAEYNFTVSKKLSGDYGILTCYIMNHFICKEVNSLKNISGKYIIKFKQEIVNCIS